MENWSYNPRVRKHKHKHKNAMALAHEMNANAGAAAFCCSSESPSAVSSECEAEADISGEGEGNGDDNSRCCSSSSSFSLSTRGRNAGDGDTWLESTSSATSMPWCAFAGGRDTVVWEPSSSSRVSEVDLMKERFSKLLLGEDMSGCGKGVCSALAISNAITNLAASVFGDLWRLEPVAPARKETWKREMEWLLCVSDSIVELVPTWQRDHQGSCMEVMITRPRSDLYLNLPALKKLDAMLLEILDSFSDNEFWYVDRGILLGDVNDDGYVAPRRHVQHHEDKWWLPILKVPANGLSDATRKQLQQHRECASQILKAAMSINTHVLSDMEVPESFVASLPKTGKACLGDVIYRYLTSEQFSPEGLLDCLDLSSEHRILEIANCIEAALRVWKEKATSKRMHNRKSNKARSKSKWGRVKSFVGDFEKRNLLSERAESLLLTLKLRFPGLSQTLLDMNKIQHNKDVGHSILESYSRVLESLAFNISARIDDVLYTDDMAKRCAAGKLSCDASTSFSSNKKAMDATANLTEYVPPLPSTSTSTYATPFATPSFSPAHHQACSETAADALSNLSRSSNTYRRGSKSKDVKDFLGGDFRSAKDSGRVDELMKIHKSVLVELEKVWSYTENIGSRKAPP